MMQFCTCLSLNLPVDWTIDKRMITSFHKRGYRAFICPLIAIQNSLYVRQTRILWSYHTPPQRIWRNILTHTTEECWNQPRMTKKDSATAGRPKSVHWEVNAWPSRLCTRQKWKQTQTPWTTLDSLKGHSKKDTINTNQTSDIRRIGSAQHWANTFTHWKMTQLTTR